MPWGSLRYPDICGAKLSCNVVEFAHRAVIHTNPIWQLLYSWCYALVLGSDRAALALRVMSRAQIRELVALFAVGSTLTVVVFFLALWLLPFERFPIFSVPRFPGFP